MAGDEDKSLQAGMNGHVTKPIDPDQLFATLQKWIKPSEKRVQARQPEISVEGPESQAIPEEEELPESLPGFDLSDGLKRLQGNKRLYRKLLLSFATDYCGAANDIRRHSMPKILSTHTAWFTISKDWPVILRPRTCRRRGESGKTRQRS